MCREGVVDVADGKIVNVIIIIIIIIIIEIYRKLYMALNL